MPRTPSFLTAWSQYLALRCFAGFVQCFDVRQNLETAGAIGDLFGRLSPRRRDRAVRNIALSFPEWSRARVEDVADRSLRHMFQMFMVDSLFMPRLMTSSSWPEHVELEDLRTLIEQVARRESPLLVTGHCGNWELLGYLISVLGYPINALARPLDNPLLNRWILSVGEARGMRIITKWGATPILQDAIQRGEPIGFIADQNAGDQGMFVPFFGRMASSYKSIGVLAMRYNLTIIAGHAQRLNDDFRYRAGAIDVIRPSDWADHPHPLFYITARFNRAIEQMVRAAPEQYVWIHRRWKSRPRYEREGREMPARTVAMLESLPWMTPAELARLRDHAAPAKIREP
ncbi:MAG: hypothetical protein KDA25_06590 [Phycisphaerales bacterium]|nr:hypothetical protein [Phycisphaerales bacterium]